MQEPLPLLIPPPKNEPQLRVGLVLEEDESSLVQLTVKCSGAIAQSGSVSRDLKSDQCYSFELNGEHIVGRDSAGSPFGSFLAPLIITPLVGECLPQRGLEISPLVAGRQFHWRKQITASFPGSIEIHRVGTHLVVINQVSFEDYIACVVGSEMSRACPGEFIRTQAITARSWARCFLGSKHPGKLYEICNDDDCQRYQGTTHLSGDSIEQVNATSGMFLVDQAGYTCAAYYSKSCGGHSELPELAFGFAAPGVSAVIDTQTGECGSLDLKDSAQFQSWLELSHPAQQLVYCSPEIVPENELSKYIGAVDESGKYYRWQVRYDHDELANILNEKTGIPIRKIIEFMPGPRGVSGRLLSLQIRYQDKRNRECLLGLQDQYDVRRAFSKSFLLSSAFTIQSERDSAAAIQAVKLNGAGWGHGIGMCQIGAVGMALSGKTYSEIVGHYFPRSRVTKAY